MLNFALAIFLLIITPGPGVLSLAGVGAAFGFRAGWRYLAGLFFGTNLVALAVVTGLGALILADPVIRFVLLALSTGYLLYLAARIALAGTSIAFSPASRQPGIRDGLLLQAVNPKAYVVNTTLFTGFPIFPEAYGLEIAVKFAIINVIWLVIHFLWLWVGSAIKRMALPPHVQRVINVGMAVAMLVVVSLAVWSAF
ncbi:Threonine/homoserine/homoserine lactone efflux protein [Litoreibacter albidus]|uniref:Threonine/homoserine/homoserine lactone efflux protein n=1 Tax=Litoreibacter albidus TaxID=670155 RepID=A0A1H2YFD8_9RHOB|nr:LysE family translocator [Litoreibacter albidus]SDX03558.1 Threonine/homoserine/homoserine lactone efflux protein [Litoreibacter albidus]